MVHVLLAETPGILALGALLLRPLVARDNSRRGACRGSTAARAVLGVALPSVAAPFVRGLRLCVLSVWWWNGSMRAAGAGAR